MVERNDGKSCPVEKFGSGEIQFFRYYRKRLLSLNEDMRMI